jgi:3-hydroxymyristoyl/3-hydroxydecanoyl-(acyl carrier protein) dehydratase
MLNVAKRPDPSASWPEIQSVSRGDNGNAALDGADALQLTLRVPPQLAWFEGHFPNQPLLPAVIQTHWALAYARRHFTLPPTFLSMHNLKFSRFVMPGAVLKLRLTYSAARSELSFEYTEADAPCSSGRIRFGA